MDIHELDADAGRRRAVHDLLAGARAPARHAGRHASPLLDAIVQQVDVRTGLVVWEWHALGHIPLVGVLRHARQQRVLRRLPPQLDPGAAGRPRAALGPRHVRALPRRPAPRGASLWTLGGKASDFRLGPGARFWFQHDARMLPGRPDQPLRRRGRAAAEGAVLARRSSWRSTTAGTARRSCAATAARRTPRRRARAACRRARRQRVRRLRRRRRSSREFTRGGRLLFDAQLPDGDGSYRVLRVPWRATPRTRPALAVQRTGPGRVAVFASWNGATSVRRWQVLGGSRGRPPGAPRLRRTARIRDAARRRHDGDPARGPRARGARGRRLATSAPAAAP